MNDLTEQLLTAGLSAEGAAQLAPLAATAISITATRCDRDALGLGASHFGGWADVPVDFKWPSFQGRPLTLLAQINLAELPKHGELPVEGTLLFFYELESMNWGFDGTNDGYARVVYSGASPLVRQPPPELTRATTAVNPCSLTFELFTSWPDPGDELAPQLRDEDFDSHHSLASDAPRNHLLGWPKLVQGCMRHECRKLEVGEVEGDWAVLLQIDSDEDRGPGWVWGDFGTLYFWIRRSDLLARRFERANLILQCT